MEEPKLCTVMETSKALRVSTHTIRSWIFKGRLPVVKLGRRCLVKTEDIKALIEKGYRPAK